MPLGSLNWQTITVPFSGSLETRADVRLLSPPNLDIARDAWFEDSGGVQTRAPFGVVMGSGQIFGGGSLTNCRRLAVVNDELCVFTDSALYSWNEQQQKWVSRGTHLAVSVDETPRFVTTGDQVTGDRAELSGTIVYAWAEGTTVYAAAIDKTTGSVLVSPTVVSTAVGRPRLVALATKILLFVDAGANNLTVRAIDPAAPATGIGGAGTLVSTSFNAHYDVVRAGTQDLAVGALRLTPSTSYRAFTVTPLLAVASLTKIRTCDGPIAVATIADGTQTQIVRGNGANVQGDLLTTGTLADVFTAQAIGTVTGTPINQITAAFAGSTARVFWSAKETTTDAVGFESKTNTVTTANVVGAQANFVLKAGVASRAFARNGSIYVWLAFAGDSTAFGSGMPLGLRGQLQNTYFLYRDTGALEGKAAWQIAGGFSPATGHLPSVQVAGDEAAWLGGWRRQIALGAQDEDRSGYAARSLMEISATFDTNDARRTVQLGKTLYLSGGIVQQYDGREIVELGFCVYPWAFGGSDGGAGALAAGTYSWISSLRWENAQGERERSTTATGEQLTLAANRKALFLITYLHVTKKLLSPPNHEVWRNFVNSPDGADFLLTTSQDPTLLFADNGYFPNTVNGGGALYTDNLTDAALSVMERHPENGGVLESLAPPGAKIVVPTETRLLIAGVTGDPDAWWYSLERGEGSLASFNDLLRVEVPPDGGAITALWADDQFVYVARETALYAFAGPGLDNTGGGQNFTLARTISRDVGVVSQEAHAQTPVGRLIKSAKGWYVVDGSGGLRYVGSAVADFDADTVVAVHTITAKHQVRILTTSRMLLWDYRGLVDATSPEQGRWAEWTVGDGLDAVLWNGNYVYLTATGPKQEQAVFTGLTYGLDVEPSWIKLSELVGYGKIGEIQILGEYRSPCLVRVRVARDYQYDGAGNPVYFDDVAWPASPAVVGSALQVAHKPSASNGWGQAYKVRVTAVAEAARATLATAAALAPAVQTSGTDWAATWQAANSGSAGTSFPGEMGNRITMSLAFVVGATPSVDVRDHFAYDPSTGRWAEDLNNIGVLVTGTTTTTVADLEAAIAAGTKLATLQAADATPGKTLAIAAMAALAPAAGSFSGGTYTAPSGEAIKLSGLALEVGLEPGLKRLPAAQKAG